MKQMLRSLASHCVLVTTVCLGGGFLNACSDSQFNSEPKKEGQQVIRSSASGEGFAQAGKSLDLYVIMDRSGSLFVDPKTMTKNSGSDPQCKRFDAFLALVEALKVKLKQGEQVRVNVVAFNEEDFHLPPSENILALSRNEIESLYRSGVCDDKKIRGTLYAKGINKALTVYQQQIQQKKLPVESVLFFSDGAARDEVADLREAIDQLNAKFPQRVYGVLLGQTTDQCSLRTPERIPLTTRECMLEVTGNAPDKLLQVDNADGLVAALTGLVNK